MLRMRFVDDMTQSQIAERVGHSQMHVSRILRRALSRIREQIKEQEEPPQSLISRYSPSSDSSTAEFVDERFKRAADVRDPQVLADLLRRAGLHRPEAELDRALDRSRGRGGRGRRRTRQGAAAAIASVTRTASDMRSTG